MELNLIAAIVIIIGIILGFVIGNLFSKMNSQKTTATLNERNKLMAEESSRVKTEIEKLRNDNLSLDAERQKLELLIAQKDAAFLNLEQKFIENKDQVSRLQEKFQKDFEILASKILEEKSMKFTIQNKENIKNILNPLQEKIQLFEKKVEQTNKESLVMHTALKHQIDGLQKLNEQMSKEAVNLTKALKGDSKAQGDWGETQLEVLLEKSGLFRDVHYSTQGGFRDDEGQLKKPDFIVHLPDNKHLIIDAKVSLTGYEEFYNGSTEKAKSAGMKKHLLSIRKHFKELGEKRYTDLYGINAPDYVLMFVPIEPALMVALSEEQNLYLEALDKNVVLVSNSTLLATLRTISSIWKHEDQKKNVFEIARQAGALYDKFEGFVQDLVKVGKSINSSKESYDLAMNKLVEGRGNLVTSVERLKKLGAKAKKSLPQNIVERASEN